MSATAEHDWFDCVDCIEDGSNIYEHVYNPTGIAEVLIVLRKPAEVSKGDTVIHDGEPRVVDLVTDTGGTVFLDFEGKDLDEDGKPECFFIVPFPADEDLSVIPATC